MISFTGFNENMVTFKCADTIKVGDLVKVTANATVGVCAAGNSFCGIVRSVRNGCASVQVSGYITLPYTGTTAPALGITTLAADGTGGVKSAAGRTVNVVEIDSNAETCGFIL